MVSVLLILMDERVFGVVEGDDVARARLGDVVFVIDGGRVVRAKILNSEAARAIHALPSGSDVSQFAIFICEEGGSFERCCCRRQSVSIRLEEAKEPQTIKDGAKGRSTSDPITALSN